MFSPSNSYRCVCAMFFAVLDSQQIATVFYDGSKTRQHPLKLKLGEVGSKIIVNGIFLYSAFVFFALIDPHQNATAF